MVWCDVCWSEEDDAVRGGCGHEFCRSCCEAYVGVDVDEGGAERVQCMFRADGGTGQRCAAVLEPALVLSLLSGDPDRRDLVSARLEARAESAPFSSLRNAGPADGVVAAALSAPDCEGWDTHGARHTRYFHRGVHEADGGPEWGDGYRALQCALAALEGGAAMRLALYPEPRDAAPLDVSSCEALLERARALYLLPEHCSVPEATDGLNLGAPEVAIFLQLHGIRHQSATGWADASAAAGLHGRIAAHVDLHGTPALLCDGGGTWVVVAATRQRGEEREVLTLDLRLRKCVASSEYASGATALGLRWQRLGALLLDGDEPWTALFPQTQYVDRASEWEENVQQAFAFLAGEFPTSTGARISRQEREALGVTDSVFTYGEARVTELVRIFQTLSELDLLPPRGTGTFVDLGSGVGKPVFIFAMLFPFARCVGIELLGGLCRVANELKREFEAEVAAVVAEDLGAPVAAIEFHEGSFLAPEEDWTDADVVFAHSTCFGQELMAELAERAAQLKPGAVFITVSKELPAEAGLALLDQQFQRFSWGVSQVYVHQAVSEVPQVAEGAGAPERGRSRTRSG